MKHRHLVMNNTKATCNAHSKSCLINYLLKHVMDMHIQEYPVVRDVCMYISTKCYRQMEKVWSIQKRPLPYVRTKYTTDNILIHSSELIPCDTLQPIGVLNGSSKEIILIH